MSSPGRAVPLAAIVLLALAVHGPLLLMQLPTNSYDANTHMFFASHYSESWFNPWNEKWYGGFSQTTYPPLVHQWIALFSHVFGLTLAYMFVQLIVVLLLPVGMYRYARLWVSERAAMYAAVGSIFLGSLGLLVYQSGQLATVTAAALTLNALPYFYEWSRSARFGALVKGVAITVAAGAAHHVTLIVGMVLFATPVFVLVWMDRRNAESDEASGAGVLSRAAVFAALAVVLIGVVLLPYFIWTYQNPLDQAPIPHPSRDNYILNPASGMNFWIIPHGALLIALPFIFLRGAADRRLRPLFFGWWITLLIGLGGTTPVARILLAPGNLFNILTFERFTFWATLMALPIVAVLAVQFVERFRRPGLVALWVAAVFTFGISVAWVTFRPIYSSPFSVDQVISFLNREDRARYRYMTLGFGNQFSYVSARVRANSVDGDYNSARRLPELTQHGAAQLYNSKYFGTNGMEVLRAVLRRSEQYGLRYIFVRDRYYEPLLAFAGWRRAEIYDNGNVSLWTKDSVPPAQPITFLTQPPAWHGLLWGTLPMASSLFAILAVLLLPERRRAGAVVAFPAHTEETVYIEEAR